MITVVPVFNSTGHQIYDNSSELVEEGEPSFPNYIRTTATVVCAVILTIGTAGNLLVPAVVCRTKELRNSTNFFLVNLSVADLLVLLVCMPTVLIELHSQPEVWLLGEAMCKIVPFVELTVAHGSIFTILAISFERYYAICKPLRAGYTCTKMRALVIIVSVWMVALLITSPILAIAEYSYMDYIDDTKVPVCLTVAQTVWKKAYFIFITTLFFWLPLVVLLVVYGVITKQLIMDRQMLHSGSDHYQMRARKQVVWMLVAVVTCFFLCLMPFRTFTMWVIVVPADRVKALGMEKYYIVLYFCRVMLYLNSAVNPILYNLISSKFRDAFINLLTCKYQRRILRQATFTTTSTSLSQHTSLKGRSSNVHSCYLPRSCVVKAHPCVETYV